MLSTWCNMSQACLNRTKRLVALALTHGHSSICQEPVRRRRGRRQAEPEDSSDVYYAKFEGKLKVIKSAAGLCARTPHSLPLANVLCTCVMQMCYLPFLFHLQFVFYFICNFFSIHLLFHFICNLCFISLAIYFFISFAICFLFHVQFTFLFHLRCVFHFICNLLFYFICNLFFIFCNMFFISFAICFSFASGMPCGICLIYFCGGSCQTLRKWVRVATHVSLISSIVWHIIYDKHTHTHTRTHTRTSLSLYIYMYMYICIYIYIVKEFACTSCIDVLMF